MSFLQKLFSNVSFCNDNNKTPFSPSIIHAYSGWLFLLQVHINQDPFDCTVAFISLPPSLQDSFPSGQDIQARIQFQFFGTPALFKVQLSKHLFETGKVLVICIFSDFKNM